jgi:hypothetical protein
MVHAMIFYVGDLLIIYFARSVVIILYNYLHKVEGISLINLLQSPPELTPFPILS